MAGHHQIWTFDLKKGDDPALRRQRPRGHRRWRPRPVQPGPAQRPHQRRHDLCSSPTARRAPSAPSRSTASGVCKTVVGVEGDGLFDFGDKDGIGSDVRLQHALGVAYGDGKLYVADTYNSKIKVIDPKKRSCHAFMGEQGARLDGRTRVLRAGRHLRRRRQALRRRHQRPPHPRHRPEDEKAQHAEAGRRGSAAGEVGHARIVPF